jgi:hypothetical protein
MEEKCLRKRKEGGCTLEEKGAGGEGFNKGEWYRKREEGVRRIEEDRGWKV